ncbi:MAG: hypothetical protein H0T75_19260 [Rhizobiales bacterium]|nr:hypothetical protein [Hyphomicrobiales bacterium]
MSTSPSVSLAAAAAGLPSRYVYWHGHSGRRYLFTATDPASLADFDDCVAMAVHSGLIAWVGEVAALARMKAAARYCRAAIYVHLLAATDEERGAVIEDLRPSGRAQLRHAA